MEFFEIQLNPKAEKNKSTRKRNHLKMMRIHCVNDMYRQTERLGVNRGRVPQPRGIKMKVSFQHECHVLPDAHPLAPSVERNILSSSFLAVEIYSYSPHMSRIAPSDVMTEDRL